jgi:hypothetical protein
LNSISLTVVALLLGATGVVLGAISLINDDQTVEESTLSLVVQEGDFSINDVPPKAQSEEDIAGGDSFTFSGKVSGDEVGTMLGGCAVADVGRPTCQVTYALDGGQITAAGEPDFSQQAETFVIPLTGGSDAYEGASGQVTVQENGAAHHEVALLLPD